LRRSGWIIAELCPVVSGQNVDNCDVRGLSKPRFKVVLEYKGDTVGLHITTPRKHRHNENLILLANYFKQKYCKANEVIVVVFDNEKDAREFSVYDVPRIPDTARAMYYLNRKEGREKLVRVNVVNNGQVETPIER
jgi:hypothetical protein